MNKIELIQALKDANGLSKTEAERVVSLFFNEMSDALARGDRVEIREFFRSLSRNTDLILGATQKQVNELRSL
jgi:nucleoid DNA-binding protein